MITYPYWNSINSCLYNGSHVSVSISNKTSYCRIPQGLEGVRFNRPEIWLTSQQHGDRSVYQFSKRYEYFKTQFRENDTIRYFMIIRVIGYQTLTPTHSQLSSHTKTPHYQVPHLVIHMLGIHQCQSGQPCL